MSKIGWDWIFWHDTSMRAQNNSVRAPKISWHLNLLSWSLKNSLRAPSNSMRALNFVMRVLSPEFFYEGTELALIPWRHQSFLWKLCVKIWRHVLGLFEPLFPVLCGILAGLQASYLCIAWVCSIKASNHISPASLPTGSVCMCSMLTEFWSTRIVIVWHPHRHFHAIHM